MCLPARPLQLAALIIFVVYAAACEGQNSRPVSSPEDSTVKVGAEVLLDQHLDSLRKQRVGLVMNPTARVDGTHMLDTLLALNVPVTALFAPEHGFRGRSAAGERIKDGIHQQTGLPVYSLYGDTRKPTDRMLEKIDLLVFDLQDVGARFYTYHVTMGKVIEAAADDDIPVWILDRPNPAGGEYVAGWLLEEQFKSFVGEYPMPVVHGMTMGELAKMMVGEDWIAHSDDARVRVVRMKGWKRSMKWPDTGLEWYPPSPNLPHFENAYLYLGTAFFEGTSMSEGRGTEQPFLMMGSPETNLSDSVLRKLNEEYAVKVRRLAFVPRAMPEKSPHPKFENDTVNGVKVSFASGKTGNLQPLSFGLALLRGLYRNTPGVEIKHHLYRLSGSRQIDSYLQTEQPPPPNAYWQQEVAEFKKRRKPYLLYP